MGDARGSIGATINAALYTVDDEPRDVRGRLGAARELALAHGLTEETGWVSYTESEAAFASGDWNRALDLGLSAIDLGVEHNYLRLTVRSIHIVVPIAAARGQQPLLQRCQDWYAGLEGKFEFPDSPYSRVIRAAQDLDLADAGLRQAYVPEVEPRIVSFQDDPSGPSWSAALDRVVRCWVEMGQVDGAQRALDATAAFMATSPSPSTHLGTGTYELMRARLALARKDAASATTAAAAALTHFRLSDAPWWKAKAIRLLERAGAADEQLVAEVENIERLLGSIRPTA
jgi:hypothetical protein